MSDESPMLVTMSWGPPVSIAGAMVEWIFSPVVQKFPEIKVALAEGGIGWMPFFLDRCMPGRGQAPLLDREGGRPARLPLRSRAR